jgi:arylformamidase
VKLTVQHRGQRYSADATQAISLAIALDFDGRQPAFYGVAPASARALEAGPFIGDTTRGGSCNVERLELIPHCHGTHTESVSHLVAGHRRPPQPPPWLLARIISITPGALAESDENYPRPGLSGEAVISRKALSAFDIDTPALIIRTLPNNPGKCERSYEGDNPHPYFTLEAIEWLVERGIEHLLVDTPSIDRGKDDGTLPAHRRFWSLNDARQPTDQHALNRTITEFIYVPDEVPDGLFLLNLQLPDWRTDAVPSRPVVFPLAGGASIRGEG